MKKQNKQTMTKLAVFAGATALASLATQARAQSSDALIDKLVEKGVLTVNEAKDLRDEADKDFKTAFQAKTGMPDWVSGYKFSGDVRGRLDHISGDNNLMIDRLRLRYRVRFGVTVNMLDNLEAGLRLGSGDSAGNPLSNNTTAENNFSKKPIWVDTAYGKWTAINSAGWLLSTTIGKMDNPFAFTPMVFDPDLTPEGAAIQGSYLINDKHTVAFNGGAFVMDEEKSNTHDPMMYGGQVLWNAKWNAKWASSVGVGAFQIVNPEQLSNANVAQNNQGNTRTGGGLLLNNYNPIIADASVTYTLDSFPFYTGAFPIKFAGEYIENPGASKNNTGYWAGVTFGKSGTKRTWDLSYRYEYLEADAWYDQLVDDDNGAFYQNAPTGGAAGYFGGTNVKGHLVKLNYSFTDSFSFACSFFMNDLINQTVYSNVAEPNSPTLRVMADLMWKF
ncbi:MAG TPA: putative porin [Candidatus Limnocylindrales bacterium]|nr:putative porin [Candidatus Limnocylindrales bacterium]